VFRKKTYKEKEQNKENIPLQKWHTKQSNTIPTNLIIVVSMKMKTRMRYLYYKLLSFLCISK